MSVLLPFKKSGNKQLICGRISKVIIIQPKKSPRITPGDFHKLSTRRALCPPCRFLQKKKRAKTETERELKWWRRGRREESSQCSPRSSFHSFQSPLKHSFFPASLRLEQKEALYKRQSREHINNLLYR